MNESTTQQLTPDLVLMAISAGLMDADLDRIRDAARNRVRYLASAKAIQLKAGDTFTLVNISPKYLAGCQVEFKEREGSFLVCRMLEHASSRFTKGSIIRVRESHVGTVQPQ